MLKNKTTTISLIFALLFWTLIPNVVFSSSENWNWVEVAGFTGDVLNSYETEPFNISSSVSVWRIVWEYEPRTDVPEDRTGLTINVYTGVSSDDKLIKISRTGIHNGNEQTRYFHEQGVFRLKLSSNTQNFTVRIEKSMGYIPEPPSDNWVEVTRFIGTKGFTTDVFACDHIEWRIRWEFDPGHWHFADMHTLQVTTYKEGESTKYFNQIRELPGGTLRGVELLNQSGTFYLEISSGLIDSYTIIVEENIDSEPAFLSSDNWVEVVRFIGGTEGATTEPFICNHVEWRIRWSISPEYGRSGVQPGFFSTNVFDNQSNTIVSQFGRIPTIENDDGTLSFSENGTFYLEINAFRINEYSIIVEQNIESIPEFPSWTILPLFIVATMVLMIVRNKLSRKGMKKNDSF